ncbi:hypothetical protein NA56DRAFT_650808 [Hyaloscypha hepaticicola]|uniref:Uncharacterized protein n=1 Tax=Hyaloscypha hepaticicola TaxID=2082293 RepID=A0A2J6PKE1_9HELO|nr:hypothetical protein NA56DRAFT_650808 [Hyaloscypha hepaticicola]
MEETKADFPPSSPPLPDDYSDVESAHSSEVEEDAATERRKYQRGGRKKSTTQTTRESRMPPVPESEVGAEPSHREEFSLEHGDTHINGGSRMNGKINTTRVEQERDPEVEKEMEGKVCPECAARKQQAAPAAQHAEQKQPSAFETGIRAFNLKRAAESAGRPVSVRAEKKKSKKKEKEKAKKKKKKREPEVDETDESSSDEDEEEETEKKPAGMAIRLDLNLIVEIFLKAKIQGDVTITFLE